LSVNCQNAAGVDGVLLGAATGKFNLQDLSIANCSDSSSGAYGLEYYGAQFVEARGVQLNGNYVGLKLYSTASGGGGNSNSFYGLQIAGGTVGVLAGALGTWGQGQNYFFNPTVNGNSLTAFAVFGVPGSAFPQDFHVYGGAPEANAGGSASSATIDGFTVYKATLYASNANVFFTDVQDEDATANPLYILQNGSTLSLANSGGYGNISGQVTQVDSTSKVIELGNHGYIGVTNGVTVWPSSLSFAQASYALTGTPITTAASDIPNSYTSNSFNIAFSDINGSVSQQTYNDPVYGTVNSVTHAASVGSPSTNRVNLGVVIPSPTQTSDMVVSFLIKADRNCSYSVAQYGSGGYYITLNLVANTWTRVLMVLPSQPSGGNNFNLIGSPEDSSGPTVSFTRLMGYSGASGPITRQIIGRISQTGYIYVPQIEDSTGTVNTGSSNITTTGTMNAGTVIDTNETVNTLLTAHNATFAYPANIAGRVATFGQASGIAGCWFQNVFNPTTDVEFYCDNASGTSSFSLDPATGNVTTTGTVSTTGLTNTGTTTLGSSGQATVSAAGNISTSGTVTADSATFAEPLVISGRVATFGQQSGIGGCWFQNSQNPTTNVPFSCMNSSGAYSISIDPNAGQMKATGGLLACTSGFGYCATITFGGSSNISLSLPTAAGTLATVGAAHTAQGTATLSSGTATVSTSSACAIGASCTYNLTNCGKNSSSAIGTLAVTSVSAGANFTITSLTSAAATATGDVSTVCWQIN